MTKLAVSIMVGSLEQALAASVRAGELGADLVEFRIDHFTDHPEQLTELVRRSDLPCIITCRPTWEGGGYDGDEQTRISILEKIGLAQEQPTYLDIELAAYQRSANLRQKVGLVVEHPGQVRPIKTGLILSSHDYQTRPADLYQRIEAMAASAACRVIKVAWQARSLRDNLEAFEIISQHHKPTIALCMGENGLPSRVLAKKFGALLTFASLEPDQSTAPGQPTVRQLKDLYRWDALQAQTRTFGVIGHPVAHSISPAIHNAGFDAIDYDGVMLPMPIGPSYEQFKATVGAWLEMPELHFTGAAVTLPHKEHLLRFVSERGGQVEPLAAKIGAANTLTRVSGGGDEKLCASNTDYAAAIDALCQGMGITRSELKSQCIAVLGAGGVARAVVAGLAHYGATVVIYNRTAEKAQELAQAFDSTAAKVMAAPWAQLGGDTRCQVFINCTLVGMHPQIDDTPMPQVAGCTTFGPGVVVFDTVYNPVNTKLLRQARAAGCVTIPGTEMFVRQAAAQFQAWTGQQAPLDLFRRVLVDQLITP